jgi:hypothetical protein
LFYKLYGVGFFAIPLCIFCYFKFAIFING